MKTRTDFVSNSSSCSFVINDPKKMLGKLHEILGESSNAFESDFFDSMTITLFAKEEHRKFIESQEVLKDMTPYSWGDELQIDIPVSTLAKLPDEVMNVFSRIELSCDDYEQKAVVNLSLLKKALHNLGVDADDDCSDFPLLFEGGDGNSVFEKVAACAFSSPSTL